ncbi:MAG: hypothetical protein MJZ33_02925 [Paludibacteraceae bacterium]|nr:hypothetical protein [Paludibacteraceae bacterium]
MNISDIDLSDAIIENIEIDRTNPGRADDIVLFLKRNSIKMIVTFKGLYRMRSDYSALGSSDQKVLGIFIGDREANDFIRDFCKSWPIELPHINYYEVILECGKIQIIAKEVDVIW